MPNDSPPDLPANIRAEVARSGIPISDVIRAVGMPPSTWYRRMDDPRSWRWGELLDLASILHCPVGRFVGSTP